MAYEDTLSGGTHAARAGLNHVALYAVLRGKKILRYTPAGIPVQEVVLEHQSEQGVEGIRRKIAFECLAVGYGSVALLLSALSDQTAALFEGYLAPQYGDRSRWVLHIHRFDVES